VLRVEKILWRREMSKYELALGSPLRDGVSTKRSTIFRISPNKNLIYGTFHFEQYAITLQSRDILALKNYYCLLN